MNKLSMVLLALLCAVADRAPAQGMMSDLLSGKLVNPQVGAYAWYNLKDKTTGQEYFLRQAIVGTEKIKRKEGWWLETELVPRVGFSSVYKMLLTGPASNTENVHRLLVREGNGAVQEVALEDKDRPKDDGDIPREAAGVETITLSSGDIQAEHYIVKDGEPPTEIWFSETIPPMGLVKMTTAEGELSLQRFGVGGKDGESALPNSAAVAPDTAEGPAAEPAPADTVEKKPEGEKGKKKSNFSPRKRAR